MTVDAKIEKLLFHEIGLESSSIGLATIEAAVRCRMSECKIGDREAYNRKLLSSKNELDSLIDEVTVPETWFFRDKEPFHYLMRYASSRWSWERPGQSFRVLSVPCSSGEEPYSIAISLLEAGLPEERIHIDAADINRPGLAKAKNGVYGKNSFRDESFQRFNRYFQKGSQGKYAVRNDILRIVNFIHANIVKPDFCAGHEPYDVVFCRNLLIYMENSVRQRTLKKLRKLLRPGGILFVGHAEALPIVDALFQPLRESGAFAYCNSKDLPTDHCRQAPAGNSDNQAKFESSPFKDLLCGKKSAKNQSAAFLDETPLAQAEMLARQGMLADAEQICHSYIESDPLNAKAFFILGIIAQMKDDLKLSEYYLLKVIYLEPEHEQALMHLAYIYDHRGDFDQAKEIRQRKKRLKRMYLD